MEAKGKRLLEILNLTPSPFYKDLSLSRDGTEIILTAGIEQSVIFETTILSLRQRPNYVNDSDYEDFAGNNIYMFFSIPEAYKVECAKIHELENQKKNENEPSEIFIMPPIEIDWTKMSGIQNTLNWRIYEEFDKVFDKVFEEKRQLEMIKQEELDAQTKIDEIKKKQAKIRVSINEQRERQEALSIRIDKLIQKEKEFEERESDEENDPEPVEVKVDGKVAFICRCGNYSSTGNISECSILCDSPDNGPKLSVEDIHQLLHQKLGL